ncbi:unnamed protein product [Schistosoma curassoni]|uniref:Uncharacterized protein n=1 Tax=Schistosoma curassoni TaxID=6186 RepID=A0A183L5U5_9TREM|nr:unnamed protein product [Schistosoma curassoni]
MPYCDIGVKFHWNDDILMGKHTYHSSSSSSSSS